MSSLDEIVDRLTVQEGEIRDLIREMGNQHESAQDVNRESELIKSLILEMEKIVYVCV